jgi:hypothetical protein
MLGDFEVVEYTNPCFPDKVMYKVLINNREFHTDNYGRLIDWAMEVLADENGADYAERQSITDKAVESFFEGTNTSKD